MNISRQWLHAISASAVPWGYTGDVTQNPKTTGISASIPAAAGAKILAIDYGRKKMGLALAGSEARIAEPHATLERINRNEDMRRLREFARENKVKQIIVGLPLRLDGTPVKWPKKPPVSPNAFANSLACLWNSSMSA